MGYWDTNNVCTRSYCVKGGSVLKDYRFHFGKRIQESVGVMRYTTTHTKKKEPKKISEGKVT
jgi:hypothetical protein